MELLFVVAAIVIMLFGFSLLYLELRRRSLQEKNDMLLRQKEIELLRQQVAANQTKEQTLLLKSQETSTSVDAFNRQFQQLYRQIIQLERDTVVSGETIEHVRQQVSAMNQVMINKKARGNWGEYQLQMLLELYAGECREVYETQYKLDNGTIGDVALHLAGSSIPSFRWKTTRRWQIMKGMPLLCSAAKICFGQASKSISMILPKSISMRRHVIRLSCLCPVRPFTCTYVQNAVICWTMHLPIMC